MTRNPVRSAIALLLAAAPLAAQNPQGVPEAPAIWREVTGVINFGVPGTPAPAFQRPHIPAYRTTSDGRVGMIVEGGNARFGLITPEKLTVPLLLDPNTVGTINPTTMFTPVPAIDFAPDPAWSRMHTCVWDDGTWPQAVGAQDRYEFDIVATARDTLSAQTSRIRFFVTRVEVLVNNPKQAGASIASVTVLSQSSGSPLQGPTAGGSLTDIHGWAFEPTVSANGRLFVVRIASRDMTWNDPAGGLPQTTPQHVDIVYSWSDVPNEPVDAANWTEFYPIALAPYDPRINTTIGFAMEPFRDPSGAPILNPAAPALDTSADIGGSYPWIDRAGNNLFLEAINDRLAPDGDLSKQTTAQGARYDNSGHPSDMTVYTANTPREDGGKHQGICVVGKWTQGKITQIDNLNNDMDYAIGMGDGLTTHGPQHRVVDLYQSGTLLGWSSPAPSWSNPTMGQLLLGYGRSTKYMPAWENDNANIIDSLESKLNYRQHATTLVYRDVVWHMNNCKQTDELVFDDFMDPDAFILSNMTGLLVHTDPPLLPNGSTQYNPYFTHHTGWDNGAKQFTGSPRLQNAASPKPGRWNVPSWGQVAGGTGRIEPAAAGGVFGKGFWMDGTNRVEYTVPAQPSGQNFDDHDWYVGLFLDTREGGVPAYVRVLRFPDSSELWLDARSQFQFKNAAGQVVHRVNVPTSLGTGTMLSDLVPDGGWCHVGLQIMDQGRLVDFYLNGLPFSRWESNGGGLFQMQTGALTIGSEPGQSNGFRGWIDEFKVLAHAVDLETACNHAGGTLIGMQDAYTGQWRTDFADRYPTWVHERISDVLRAKGEPTFGAYACFYDYRQDYGVNRQSVASLTAGGQVVHLRSAVHFPEGPRFSNRPRPDTLTNKFCLSCHHGQGDPGLDLIPLAPFGINAPSDPRRQPSDPPRMIFGNIPAGLVDSTGQPTGPKVTPATGTEIDLWRFARYLGPGKVVSVTLVDDTSGEDLMDMPLSSSGPLASPPVLDPITLGTVDLSMRVNLEHGQDPVNFTLNTQPTQTLPIHPYPFDLPLGAIDFVNPNVVTIKPSNGVQLWTGFQIQDLTAIRQIADYRLDFQAENPKEGWLYGWNANGVVTNADSFRSMNWLASANRYTDKGLAFPESSELHYGSLTATGGHPGKGTSQGVANDRFAMVGYRVKWPGKYVAFGTADAANVSTTGLEARVMAQLGTTNALTTHASFTTSGPGPVAIDNTASFANLAAGDILWVAIGPNGHANFDGFTMDYQIYFVP